MSMTRGAQTQRPQMAGMVRAVHTPDGTIVDLASYPQRVQDAYDGMIDLLWQALLVLAACEARDAAQSAEEQSA